MNKKCIIFASHIPTPSKLYVGKQSLDKFIESFHDYDIYIGINNSCDEWIEMIEDYKVGVFGDKLNIFYEITPAELLDGAGGPAYQTALRLLKNSNKKYDIYWFGHTKGAVSHSNKVNIDNFRNIIFSVFWDKKEIIENEIFKNNFSLYSPYAGICGIPNYINTTLSLFIDGNMNDDVCSFYSFWVHSGEVINKFIDKCDNKFFNTNLITHKRLSDGIHKTTHGANIDPNVDKYFFERDFPMVYQKLCDKPKFLWWDLGNQLNLHLLYDNENNKKINF